MSYLLSSSLNMALDHRIILLSETSPAYGAPERLPTLCQSRDAIQQTMIRTTKSLRSLLQRDLLSLLPINL